MINRDVIINEFIEIDPLSEAEFLKVKETLSRIGVSSIRNGKQVLFQSCHILHKKGKYYIVHFKEMFMLDNGVNDLLPEDLDRRNKIAILLQTWNLVKLKSTVENVNNPFVKVVSYGDKANWTFVTKYNIGEI